MRKRTRLLEQGLGLDLDDSGLVRDGGDELVVHNRDLVVRNARGEDEVGDTGRVRERRDVTANLVEGHDEVLGEQTRELRLRLVTNDHDGGVLRDAALLGERTAGSLRHGGVDTTAKTLVGRDDEEQGALASILSGRVLEELCTPLWRSYTSE